MRIPNIVRRLVLATLAGVCLLLSFPSAGVWILSLVGVAFIAWALIGSRLYEAVIVGFVSGLIMWLGLIRWLTLYLGPVPWLALGILQTIFFVVGAVALWLVLNRLRHPMRNSVFSSIVTAVVGAAVWSAREIITASWPYGGFSWARLAQSQSESPFRFIVAWGGTAFLSFVVAFLALWAVEVLRAHDKRPTLIASWVVVVLASMFVPAPYIPITGTTTVLAVQGNSKAGLFDDRASGQILLDHISGTLPYAGQEVDMIVWPENAADSSPLTNLATARLLTAVAAKIDAPIVTGSVIQDTDGSWYNSSLVWSTAGKLVGRYDKLHPVPFAEYMPDRTFWRQLAPELVDLVNYDYRAGNRSPVVEVSGVQAGITICFDVTSEQQLREMALGGAELILAQTNNADFGKTDENLQQLAITRLAAIETGRSIVNISTVGTSAVLSPTGDTLDSIPAYEPGAMVTDVPLARAITPAIILAPWMDMTMQIIAILGLLFTVRWRRRP